MTSVTHYRIALLVAIVTLFSAVQTQAGSVYNLSTGSTPWQVIAKPAADPNPLGPAVIINPNPGWNSSLVDADTKWIGIEPNNKTYGYAGDYVYELVLAIDNPGDYVVFGQFTSDNLVKSLKLNGVELLVAPQTDVYSFRKVFNYNGTSLGQLTLTATVFNAPPPDSQPDPNNPTGFILDGQARVVPLPAAAWAGMSMLAGLGIIRKIRRH